MNYEVKKFIFEDIDRVISAFSKIGSADNSEMGKLIKTIVSCGIHKSEVDIKEMEAEKALELFREVMEVNRDFFMKFAKDIPEAIAETFTSISPEKTLSEPSQKTE